MSSIITPQEMAEGILKIINGVASKYPEQDQERLKAAMLEQLAIEMFNGPMEGNAKNNNCKTE